MKNCAIRIVYKALLLFLVTSCVTHLLDARTSCSLDICENQFEVLHPAYHFNTVQRMCVEVGTDLDVASSTPEIQKMWGEQTDYLLDQFLKLYTSVANLITNKKEAKSYLKEDAFFLIELVNAIYEKHKRFMLSNPDISTNILSCLAILIDKSRQKIQEVLKFNQEQSLRN